MSNMEVNQILEATLSPGTKGTVLLSNSMLMARRCLDPDSSRAETQPGCAGQLRKFLSQVSVTSGVNVAVLILTNPGSLLANSFERACQ